MFDLEWSPGCIFDKLVISNVAKDGEAIVVVLCGNKTADLDRLAATMAGVIFRMRR